MYYNPTLTESDLLERLTDFDDEVFSIMARRKMAIRKIDIIIAGSSSLMLNKVCIPKTEDIDILFLSEYIQTNLLDKYDMNTRVMGTEWGLPYYCQDRAYTLSLDTKVIQYKVLTIEDAVIGKLVAYREKR